MMGLKLIYVSKRGPANPLPEHEMTNCQLDLNENLPMNVYMIVEHFHAKMHLELSSAKRLLFHRDFNLYF